jgi:hypothetical protein
MEDRVAVAIGLFFTVVAIAPLAMVVVYRCVEVPARRREVEAALRSVLGPADETVKRAAQEALRANPYVSDPHQTFDFYHRSWRYALPLLVLVVLTGSSTYVCYSWVMAGLRGAPVTPTLVGRVPTVVIAAVAGGLVWSLYQITNRIRAGELGPADLRDIDLGLLAAGPVGWAFSLIVVQDAAASAAFTASAFPIREAMRMTRQYATRKMLDSAGASAAVSRPAERHLGTAIEGLSDETLTRLAEIRIATALDMAYSDPIKIMLQTGFALPLIVDWIDQSVWALYVGDQKAELTRHGIRCALDACEFVDLHLLDREGSRLTQLSDAGAEALRTLAAKMGTHESLLQDLLFRVYTDPQAQLIRRLWYTKGLPELLRAG